MTPDTDAIKARADAASPGPWIAETTIRGNAWISLPYVKHAWGVHGFPDEAEFIAHAREDIPALLAEVERLRSALSDIHRMARVFDTPRDVGRVVAFVGDVRQVAERAGGVS